MWWAVGLIAVLTAGGVLLWWGWRHIDEVVPVPVSGPLIGFVPCLGAVPAPVPAGESGLAAELLAGRLTADAYRAAMERLAAADVGRPVRVPD
ncbi:hypothetical protein [Spirilliplanes yamanashiensis]|nr:hypothetical protein [Spirilliplanes yamanashiensis]MDP9818322.1 hypothetical protein [Spirilliplanes yamanashiensis]